MVFIFEIKRDTDSNFLLLENIFNTICDNANENANGLLRQYVPKGTDLRLVSNELVALALSRINYRPKRCLGFKQPAKVFEEMRLAA